MQLLIDKWLDVEKVMPLAMKNDVHLYDTRQKLVFIASGFSVDVKEYDYIYHEMLRYVQAIYINIKSMILVNDASYGGNAANKINVICMPEFVFTYK